MDASAPTTGTARRVPPLHELSPPALVDGQVRLDAEEVRHRALAVARGLRFRGVRRGDVVAMQLPNWWETVVTFHACWWLGAAALPIHHRADAQRRDRLVERTRPRLLLVAATLDPPPGAVRVRGQVDDFAELMQSSAAPAPSPIGDPGDLAVLLATSGSTGHPKLVRHTHRGLHHKARVMARVHGLTTRDVVLMPAPMSHISGLLNGVLLPGAARMTTVLMDRWVPRHALELIPREGVSFMIGPPTFFIDLARDPSFRPAKVAPLRQISTGGAGVTPTFAHEATETFGAWVKRTYGSTEAPTVTSAHAGDPPWRGHETDGRPTGDVRLRVVDPDTRRPLPPDRVGELQVRGSELFDGYTDAAATLAAHEDGWFCTGDLAHLDDEGWCTIVGRLSDTIIRGGENISPAAVEAACASLPDVHHVVVVGVPDDRLGERVALVVEAEDLPRREQVHTACREAGLERFAFPDQVLRVETIPVLDAGKPDRGRLADLAATEGVPL